MWSSVGFDPFASLLIRCNEILFRNQYRDINEESSLFKLIFNTFLLVTLNFIAKEEQNKGIRHFNKLID